MIYPVHQATMAAAADNKEPFLHQDSHHPGLGSVLRAFFPIGFLSFGGTAANMAMFMKLMVEELKWVSKTQYSELLGLCQSLPGPSAAQILLCTVTVATGRPSCGIIALLFFMIPASIVLALLGSQLGKTEDLSERLNDYHIKAELVENWSASIGCVAIALVAGGAWELGQKCAVDKLTKCIWLGTCLVCFATLHLTELNAPLTLGCLVFSAVAALAYYPANTQDTSSADIVAVGISSLAGYFLFWIGWLLLAVLFIWPLFAELPPTLAMIAPYYRVGCLVFGGGPVVIPLLLFQLVSIQAITSKQFSLGFAAVQLMPGPMFNLSAFTGALHHGFSGALLCWAAMILPGISMALGALPFYVKLRREDRVQRALKGVNSAAAGLMGSALLLLWQEFVDLDKHSSVKRICLSLLLTGSQQIFSVKAYWLVLIGLSLGALATAFDILI
mmetsp:Transcript_37544/g.69875  ORF Transcript_37544/g.69875 Transcript_37544/m.69875 type:complete len:445 (-) Transcript_37544:14-1348(-)